MRYFPLFTVFIIFVVPLSSYSQLSKRNLMVRGSGSYISGNPDDNGFQSSSAALDIGVGYFFFDKFVAGLNTEYVYEYLGSPGSPPLKVGLAGLGPSFRYYILPKDSEFNVFSEAFSLFLKSTLGDVERIINYGANGGVCVFLTSTIAAELSGGYQVIKRNISGVTDKSFRYRIGFQIFINSKYK